MSIYKERNTVNKNQSLNLLSTYSENDLSSIWVLNPVYDTKSQIIHDISKD